MSTSTHRTSYLPDDAHMPDDKHKRAAASPEVESGSGAHWISKVETVKNNRKLRAIEEDIRRLEQRRGR